MSEPDTGAEPLDEALGDVTDAASDADVTEYRRPLRLVPEQAPAAAIKRLIRKLRASGATEAAATAIAETVTDPDQFSILLDNPRRYRVPGANLLVVNAEAYTARLVADPTNPRVGTTLAYPVAIAPGSSERARFAPIGEAEVGGPFELRLEVHSFEALVWQLGQAMAETVRQNTPRPSIANHGVMEPPLAIATVVADESGASLGRVMVREGSSRLAHAQAILGVTARAALLNDSAREHAATIAGLNTIARSSASAIREEDAARVRVATIPVEIVVGYEPDPGLDLSVGDALAAKVAQDHLNHKKQWEDAAKEVLLGDHVLQALRDAGELGADRYLWLAGRLTPDEALAAGLPVNADDRWTELVSLLTTRRNPAAKIVRSAIASVLDQEGAEALASQVRASRLPLAVSLAMRERRGVDTESSVDKFSRVLANAMPNDVWTRAWSPSRRSLDDLRDAAIDDAAGRWIGPAGIELLVRASWYLGLNGQVAMPRNDLGPGGDRRLPRELLLEMLQSERGVRQLYQAIADGRQGSPAGVVTTAGEVDVSGVGGAVELTDQMVRETLAPRSGPPAPPPRNPIEEFLDAVAAYRRAINGARDADATLAAVPDEYGRPLIDERGLELDTAAELRGILEDLQRKLNAYERARERAQVRAEARIARTGE